MYSCKSCNMRLYSAHHFFLLRLLRNGFQSHWNIARIMIMLQEAACIFAKEQSQQHSSQGSQQKQGSQQASTDRRSFVVGTRSRRGRRCVIQHDIWQIHGHGGVVSRNELQIEQDNGTRFGTKCCPAFFAITSNEKGILSKFDGTNLVPSLDDCHIALVELNHVCGIVVDEQIGIVTSLAKVDTVVTVTNGTCLFDEMGTWGDDQFQLHCSTRTGKRASSRSSFRIE